jgi:stress response protein SCP2
MFGFHSNKTAPAAPPVPLPNLLHALIRKRWIFPALPAASGESKTLARQLDVTLMRSGFKLTPDLLVHVGRLDFESALTAAQNILTTIKELVGDHVKHNPYFIRFPSEVPDTVDFWVRCIVDYYLDDVWQYGQHLHTFEEMVQQHSRLQLKPGVQLKTIHLGGELERELCALYSSLAGATVPLNAEDCVLLAALFAAGHVTDVPVRIRENKAILNAIRLSRNQLIEVDTVVDVLRVACALSEGDVTLATPTKFKSFSRRVRRQLVAAIDALVARDVRKADDVSAYKERFKRLAEKLHPREYPQFKHVALVFDFAGGTTAIETFNRRAHLTVVAARQTHDFRPALETLSERPGVLLKHIDLVLRSGDSASHAALLTAFRDHVTRISGRNLLNLEQHLVNRTQPMASRIFVNRLGGGFATKEVLPMLTDATVAPILSAIRKDLYRRVPATPVLAIDWESLAGVATPITEKSKSDGFAVLPRGSTFPVTRARTGSLRFFVYWKQREHRTDYDLSCAFYDANFEFVTQVSWTNLRGSGDAIIHSGDFTDAKEGATEFLDIDLASLDPRVAYILPSINYFTGEDFAHIEEAFFGFMERPVGGRGLPFEARTVSTKFALKGSGKVCIPMVFIRAGDGLITGKWLDVYTRGLSWANRVEDHKFTTVGLAKAILDRAFTPLTQLVELYQRKAARVVPVAQLAGADPVTYIGLRRPEILHRDSKVITLESFRTLIPS